MSKKPILNKGDRVILTRGHDRKLGPGSEGIVMHDVYDHYDSVAVDFVRAHDSAGNRNTSSWNGGHSCGSLIPLRNNRYYGQWIDYCLLKRINHVSDDDILLLI